MSAANPVIADPLDGTGDLFSGWAKFGTNSPSSVVLINTQNADELREQVKQAGGGSVLRRPLRPEDNADGLPHGLRKVLQLRNRIEELSGLPCVLVSYTQIMRRDLEKPNIKAIVMTAWKARDDKAHEQELQELIKLTTKPFIAFCGGHHLIYLTYGGKSGIMRKLKPGEKDPNPKYYPGLYKEWDFGTVRIVKRDPIFNGLPDEIVVPQRHYAQCKELPAEFDLLASSAECKVQVIKHRDRLVYGTQFHPEIYDDAHPHGKTLLQNFFRIAAARSSAHHVWVEAEGFARLGGWTIDQQVMDQMGSPFLLAHGLGVPVADASTTVEFPQAGAYRVWVRTRDWVAPWKTPETPPAMKAVGTPGKFQVVVDGKALATTFGTEDAAWHWQDGGIVQIRKKRVALALHDLTGFAGRCDAVLFSNEHKFSPPDSGAELQALRRMLSGWADPPPSAGRYDLVIVGGGMAGCCAAVSAARLGCKVALIQNRPVLGGNNSSEVRVGLSGLIHQQPYPRLGDLVDELGPIGHWNLWEAKREPDSPRSKHILSVIEEHPEKKIHNAGPASNYEDRRKLDVVRAEKNISLFLNHHVNAVEMNGSRIAAVVAQDIRTGERRRFTAQLFADCTGDGSLGFLAKADFREGREAKGETQETLAADEADKLVMGTSVQWYAVEEKGASTFPDCPWAVQFDDKTCIKSTRGDWDWEAGATRDQVAEIEHIRDYSFRVIYGNWAVLKNHPRFKEEFARQRLAWIACIGGKRESRRLLGDVILQQQDIVGQREFPDACVTTTWTIDLHYPKKPACACEAFQSEARHLKIKPYPIPYRCLYSRNIENLMMAGRNISVTHVALGTVRVQRTTGMMGEVLGMAASLCTKHSATPRGVFDSYLDELKALMQRGVGKQDLR